MPCADGSDGGTVFSHFRLAWRYVEVARAQRVDELLDRELAMLWRLTHPR